MPMTFMLFPFALLAGGVASTPHPRAYDLIDAILATPPRNRGEAERLVGVPLTVWTSSTFVQSRGTLRTAEHIRVEIDLTEPTDPRWGISMDLSFKGGCLPWAVVQARYPRARKPDFAPHGRSDGLYGVNGETRWGSYGFSRDYKGRQCVRKFSVSLRSPASTRPPAGTG